MLRQGRLIIVVTKLDEMLAEDEDCTEDKLLSEIQIYYKDIFKFSGKKSLNNDIFLISGTWALFGRCYRNKIDNSEYKKYISIQQTAHIEFSESPIEEIPNLLVTKSNIKELEKRYYIF